MAEHDRDALLFEARWLVYAMIGLGALLVLHYWFGVNAALRPLLLILAIGYGAALLLAGKRWERRHR